MKEVNKMRDQQRNNNFWADLFKWFLIWKLLSFLARGFIFVCKVIFTALLQLAYLIAIGIKKLIPIVKEKFEQFKLDYEQKYRPKIKAEFSKVKEYFSNFFYKCKNKIASFKLKNNENSKIENKKEEKQKNISLKKVDKQKANEESDFTLMVKKIKYWIIDFFYTYEFQVIIGIIVLVIVVTLIVLKITAK